MVQVSTKFAGRDDDTVGSTLRPRQTAPPSGPAPRPYGLAAAPPALESLLGPAAEPFVA